MPCTPRPAGWRSLALALATLGAVATGCSIAESVTGTREYHIPSPAMERTVLAGSTVVVALHDYKLVRRGIYVYHPNGHGDTGVPRDEVSSDKYLKRIIGMPGEWIEGRNGHVRICAGPAGRGCTTLIEPYVSSDQATFGPTFVPPGRYFIMGDNRAFSDDSRASGSIRASQFIGRYVKTL